MGRRRLPDGARRESAVKVRLRPEERSQLNAIASQAGVSISTFMRRQVLQLLRERGLT